MTISAANASGTGSGTLMLSVYTSTDTAVYLSNLTWTSAINGWGPAEKDESNGESLSGDGTTITLNGQTYTKGLGVHAYPRLSTT